jgi:hypothetical protein
MQKVYHDFHGRFPSLSLKIVSSLSQSLTKCDIVKQLAGQERDRKPKKHSSQAGRRRAFSLMTIGTASQTGSAIY